MLINIYVTVAYLHVLVFNPLPGGKNIKPPIKNVKQLLMKMFCFYTSSLDILLLNIEKKNAMIVNVFV